MKPESARQAGTKRIAATLALMLLAFCTAHAEITFYTEYWSSLNSNWTVVAGTPVASGGWLRNSSTDPTTHSRLLYAPGPPTQDYSVQTPLLCSSTADVYARQFHHYLRVSGNNYYRVTVFYYPPPTSLVSLKVYRVGASTTLLGTVGNVACGTMKSSIQGSNITVAMNGVTLLSLTDSTYPSGNLGVGTVRCDEGYLTGIRTMTVLAYTDTEPPTVPTGLAAVPYGTYANLSWNPSSDNLLVTGYKIYRDGDYLGSSTTTSFTDVTVYPVTSYNYTVLAYDGVT